MGDKNQVAYLKARVPSVDGPVLEVGSRDEGITSSFRDFYPGEYVGVDLQAGKGVDLVMDLSQSIEPLREGHFALVICCSVLEHVKDPWAMARNIVKLLRPGGKVYVSVPWAWRFHDYPDDYWRFSWRGIEALFPTLTFGHPEYSTTREGEFLPAVKDADNNLAVVIEGRKFIPYLMLNTIGWIETSK